LADSESRETFKIVQLKVRNSVGGGGLQWKEPFSLGDDLTVTVIAPSQRIGLQDRIRRFSASRLCTVLAEPLKAAMEIVGFG
jgi:hypothetical protein